jgi:hypothetical protein
VQLLQLVVHPVEAHVDVHQLLGGQLLGQQRFVDHLRAVFERCEPPLDGHDAPFRYPQAGHHALYV